MRSRDPTFPLFPIFSCLGFILALIPLPWHVQAWNSGTCAFMIWTAVACLNLFVNSLVWKGNVFNNVPIWCDVSSKLYIGVSIGIPASILCISRRLYSLLSLRTSSVTRADKRKMIVVDICISLGIPVVSMALHYVIQGHRFDIMEDIGCYPSVYNVTLAYPLYLIWSPLLGAISFVYSALTLQSFWKRRAQFAQLVTSNSGMTISRYLRLMTLAGVDIIFNVPVGLLVIYIGSLGHGPAPWISWQNTHYNFSRVDRIPAIIWRSDPSYEASIEFTRWLPVFCSLVFFALFGFAAEARKQYHTALWAVAKFFGIQPRISLTHSKTLLPSWVKLLKTHSKPGDMSPDRNASPYKISSSSRSSSHTATDVEPYAFKMNKTLPPPPRYRPTSRRIPFDIPPSIQPDFPVSPTSSMTTTVLGSAMSNYDVRPKLSIESLSSVDQPPPLFINAADLPGYGRPFSSPLSYPPLSYPITVSHPGCTGKVTHVLAESLGQ